MAQTPTHPAGWHAAQTGTLLLAGLAGLVLIQITAESRQTSSAAPLPPIAPQPSPTNATTPPHPRTRPVARLNLTNLALPTAGIPGPATQPARERQQTLAKADEVETDAVLASDRIPASGPELLHDLSVDAPVPAARSFPRSGESKPGAVRAGGRPRQRSRVLRLLVTAYCPCPRCCGPDAEGVTASGRPISYNGGAFVAADTTVLPFGTRVRIPGYAGGRPVEVIDRGGAIKGHRIDVFFPTHEQAREWGKRWVSVVVEE